MVAVRDASRMHASVPVTAPGVGLARERDGLRLLPGLNFYGLGGAGEIGVIVYDADNPVTMTFLLDDAQARALVATVQRLVNYVGQERRR